MPTDRPSDSDPVAADPTTRQTILKAAANVFLARGYARTSMELVATESGVGRRTVFNQFTSKKTLFDETVALLWDEMPLKHIISRMGIAQPPDEVLSALGNGIADFWAPDEAVAFLRMIISESIQFPELAQTLHTSGRGPARIALVRYLKRLHTAKILHIPDLELAAAQFVGLITVTLLWDRLLGLEDSPNKQRREQVVGEAVGTFLSRYSSAGQGFGGSKAVPSFNNQ